VAGKTKGWRLGDEPTVSISDERKVGGGGTAEPSLSLKDLRPRRLELASKVQFVILWPRQDSNTPSKVEFEAFDCN